MVGHRFRLSLAQGGLLLLVGLYSISCLPGALAEPVSISEAPLDGNSTAPPLSCQSFQCSGERCYQEETLGNNTETCHNASHCELFRLNSTSYTARCSQGCGNASDTEMCGSHGGSSDLSPCTLECCSSPNCLRLNATAYGELPPTTTMPAPTKTTIITTAAAATTTTTTVLPKNGKVCANFTCQGNECYKGQKAKAGCTVGFDFCEVKKIGTRFVAGCSNKCQGSGPTCSPRSAALCYQECCRAKPKTSCLKLDGRVHFSVAGGAMASTPLLQGLGLMALHCLALFFLAGPN